MNITAKQAMKWLGVAIFVAYIGGVNGSYHFDDSHSVESNIAIRSISNIPTLWTDNKTSSFIPENRVYRPLVYTFYTFCRVIGGGATWPFHAMKMFMHLLFALAMFQIWRRLWQEPGWFPIKDLKLKIPLMSTELAITPDSAALLLALVFAVHPATSECVDYVAATTSLQCSMFYVWAFYLYLLFRDTGQRKMLLWSLVLYFAAVASKEEGITLPAVIGMTELFLNKSEFLEKIRRGFIQAIPYAVLGIALAGWIYVMHPTSGNESRGVVSPLDYFITQWRAYLWYMRLWFWPWDLNADTASMVFSKSVFEPLAIQAAIGNLLIIAFAWFQRKRFPAMAFGLLWFYITIAPASSIVVLAEAINEHRMYLSYLGFAGGTFTVALFCAEKFFAEGTRARRLGWITALILLGCWIGVQERNRVWRNDENLWADTVEKNPTSGRALNNLALVYLARGEYAKAVEYLDKCEQYWPAYMYCPLNKGISLQALKKMDEAEKSYLRAYALNSHAVHTNFHLGRFYQDVKKDDAKAIPLLQAAIDATGGRYPAADIQLASSYMNLRRFDEARSSLVRALSVEPDNTLALFNIGKLEFELGSSDRAAEIYRQLLRVAPNHLQGWYNYGVVELARGKWSDAKTAFERTVAIDPKSEQGWYNLSYAAERLNDGDTALNAARQLSSIRPANPQYQAKLKALEKAFGHGT